MSYLKYAVWADETSRRLPWILNRTLQVDGQREGRRARRELIDPFGGHRRERLRRAFVARVEAGGRSPDNAMVQRLVLQHWCRMITGDEITGVSADLPVLNRVPPERTPWFNGAVAFRPRHVCRTRVRGFLVCRR